MAVTFPRGHVAWVFVALATASCGSDETTPALEPVSIEAGACGHGLYVTSSDYTSTSVSILGFDGRTLAADWIDSGSAAPGLSAALSGDVVVPTSRGDRVVWIDRSAASLTWADPVTATLHQLSVGTGFGSNPWDLLQVSPGKTYVARYQKNASPGREPFDAGSDLLVVDDAAATITGSIDLSVTVTEPGIEPRPTRLLRRGDEVLVLLGLLGPISIGDTVAGEGRLAVVDPLTDGVTRVVPLPGARNCNGLAVSPGGRYVAVSCSGTMRNLVPTVSESSVIVLDAVADFSEVARFPASTFGQAFTFSLGFASESHVLAPAFGSKEPPASDDLLLDLDVVAGTASELHRARFLTLGDVRCACDRCWVADAASDRLLGVRLGADGIPSIDAPSDVVTHLGLPPLGIGAF